MTACCTSLPTTVQDTTLILGPTSTRNIIQSDHGDLRHHQRHRDQAVDLHSASVPIVSRMGLLDAFRDKITAEEGLNLLYLDGVIRSSFSASGNVEAQSATSDFEVLRSDLARIFMDAMAEL